MNYFGVGLAAGVLTGIIVFIIATVLGRKSGTCTSRQYDERQLALRGKAFGFSVLQEHAVMTPVISIFFETLIIKYLSIQIIQKKQIKL